MRYWRKEHILNSVYQEIIMEYQSEMITPYYQVEGSVLFSFISQDW